MFLSFLPIWKTILPGTVVLVVIAFPLITCLFSVANLSILSLSVVFGQSGYNVSCRRSSWIDSIWGPLYFLGLDLWVPLLVWKFSCRISFNRLSMPLWVSSLSGIIIIWISGCLMVSTISHILFSLWGAIFSVFVVDVSRQQFSLLFLKFYFLYDLVYF